MVTNVQDLHRVGTFCQIVELQDLSDKLRMIVMAHRRIRLLGQVIPEELEDEKEKSRRRRKRMRKPVEEESEEVVAKPEETPEETSATTEKAEQPPSYSSVPVLIVETENVKQDPVEMTTEVKVHDKNVLVI